MRKNILTKVESHVDAYAKMTIEEIEKELGYKVKVISKEE